MRWCQRRHKHQRSEPSIHFLIYGYMCIKSWPFYPSLFHMVLNPGYYTHFYISVKPWVSKRQLCSVKMLYFLHKVLLKPGLGWGGGGGGDQLTRLTTHMSSLINTLSGSALPIYFFSGILCAGNKLLFKSLLHYKTDF
jgi:hypothetical protein